MSQDLTSGALVREKGFRASYLVSEREFGFNTLFLNVEPHNGTELNRGADSTECRVAKAVPC